MANREKRKEKKNIHSMPKDTRRYDQTNAAETADPYDVFGNELARENLEADTPETDR